MTTILEHDTDLDVETPKDRRYLRTGWPIILVVVMAAAGVGAWRLAGTGEPIEPTAETTAPVATAEVTRQTLSDTRTFAGTLGHGDGRTVSAAQPGVITGLASAGAEIDRGTELFRIDEQPVTGLFGIVPMYRDLHDGKEGPDVEQLETNLAELGYDGFTVDDTFTSATTAAVERWQEDLGRGVTGVVGQGDVVFLPGPSRVDALHTEVGAAAAPGAGVLELTGSNHIVSLQIEIRDRELLAVGTDVTVQLPNGSEVTGEVTAANVTLAESPQDGGGDTAESQDTLTVVEVTLDDTVDQAFLGAPADVIIDVDERVDVLTVPVNALLALIGGGHGVEVVADDGTIELVPVETGLFAEGVVEITGSRITEGTVVGVAGR